MNTTINVSLPKGLADLAKQKVKQGYFSSVSEVIRDALRSSMLSSDVPTFQMSQKAEKVTRQARKDHADGKTTLLKDIDDLDML